MFKGFQSKSRQFNGFPNLNFQVNNEAYGFSGCTFWLDAAYGTNTQTDLAAVSTWQSKIGEIRFTQATAGNQPRYYLSDINFNNLPSINYQSSARKLISNNSIGLLLNSSIAFVAQSITLVSNAQISLMDALDTETSTNTISIGENRTDTTGIGIYNRSSTSTMTNVISSNIQDSNAHIVVISSGASGTAAIYVDGLQITTGTWIPLSSYSVIGRSNATTGNVWSIAEVLFYNRKINSDEAIILSDRLNSKYAIY